MRQTLITPCRWARSAALALLVLLAPPTTADAETIDLFLYSPQVGATDLSLLKRAAEDYLNGAGVPARVQPFARLDDLEREYARTPAAFLLSPQWALTRACLFRTLTPIARPMRAGKPYDRHALMGGSGVQDASELAHGSVAASVPLMPPAQLSAGLSSLQEDQPSVRVVHVPKDTDALLAIRFGQVPAGFSSVTQFEMLSESDPNATKGTHELGYSHHASFPQIYRPATVSAQTTERLTTALESASLSAAGRHFAGLLGYDQWIRVDEAGAVTHSAGKDCTK